MTGAVSDRAQTSDRRRRPKQSTRLLCPDARRPRMALGECWGVRCCRRVGPGPAANDQFLPRDHPRGIRRDGAADVSVVPDEEASRRVIADVAKSMVSVDGAADDASGNAVASEVICPEPGRVDRGAPSLAGREIRCIVPAVQGATKPGPSPTQSSAANCLSEFHGGGCGPAKVCDMPTPAKRSVTK